MPLHRGSWARSDHGLPDEGWPAASRRATHSRSVATSSVFGGFDSYIEEFFPFLSTVRDSGWTIVAFEGPGQGTPLEESKTVIIPDEPRVKRVVAWDILPDFHAALLASLPPPLRALAEGAADAEGKRRLDATLTEAATKSPILDWMLKQAYHVRRAG